MPETNVKPPDVGGTSPKKAPPDWERIEPMYRAVLADHTLPLHGEEADLVDAFVAAHRAGVLEDRLPHTAADTVVRGPSQMHGRAELVLFHVDGTATVIAAKDGSKGYNHVVSGIWQAGLYAVQLGMPKGAINQVRRALMWTSTGSPTLDAVIELICMQANVVPLPWQSMRELIAMHEATRRLGSQA